jgi:MEDS: MEthanogen/methylotroph, DcmR Sensory domain
VNGSHIMCIHGTQNSQFMHALHFLKEGLRNNESCVLITNYLNKEKIEQIFQDLWNSSYEKVPIVAEDLRIISASEWYFDSQKGKKIDTSDLLKSYLNLSNKSERTGNTPLRAFVDMSFFFKHQLVEFLVECESKFSRVPVFPLKLICAYLESDVSSLSTNTYNILQEHHKHVYLIPE